MNITITVFLALVASTLVAAPAQAERIYMCRDALDKATFQQTLCGPGQTEVFRGNYARNLPLKDVRERQQRMRRAIEGRKTARR